ncbi:hypothetical protein ATE92_0420 [Ulvibacter sp. MAR_2010_11]|uniref:DUF6702 family protein n=1 Tax=Ulvibacter sp. MAR_2010_11 TaxID=1250229 RepID=UPI000C2C71E6|nr:DUF6702 family protein [Ulvibacter sp. MAR_2010_11]PKA82292.1 hypothetical protein ATE92_0420 [Ulvibacter sp. MAR_2010_11]
MNLLRIATLLLLFTIVTAASAHKFYVSITKIEYVQEKQSVQIITKIFIDDLEDVLQQRYKPTISLATQNETAEDLAYMKQYILQKLQIEVNGKPATPKFIGSEYETDVVKVYLEITGVQNLKTLEIENYLLLDMFDEQQNIVHLKTSKSRRSLVLDKDNPKGVLNFD